MPTIAIAFRLPGPDFAWVTPAIVDDPLLCASCGRLLADKGWSVQETVDPLVVGVAGAAVLSPEKWGYFQTVFLADPTLFPTVVVQTVSFDSGRNLDGTLDAHLTYIFSPLSGIGRYVLSRTSAGTWRPTWDAVFGTIVVPEPGSLALLGLGLAGLGLSRRRKAA